MQRGDWVGNAAGETVELPEQARLERLALERRPFVQQIDHGEMPGIAVRQPVFERSAANVQIAGGPTPAAEASQGGVERGKSLRRKMGLPDAGGDRDPAEGHPQLMKRASVFPARVSTAFDRLVQVPPELVPHFGSLGGAGGLRIVPRRRRGGLHRAEGRGHGTVPRGPGPGRGPTKRLNSIVARQSSAILLNVHTGEVDASVFDGRGFEPDLARFRGLSRMEAGLARESYGPTTTSVDGTLSEKW